MEEKNLIIGNGFDLRHFLPTSYNHLISILCEIEKLPEETKTVTFLDLFGRSFKEKNEWFFNQINEFYETENFIFDNDAISSIRSRLKLNSWFEYFKSVDENKIETWIDFETEIERILMSILEYFTSFNNNEFESKPRYGFIDNIERGFFVPVSQINRHFKSQLQVLLLKYFGLLNEGHPNLKISKEFVLGINQEIQHYKEKDFFNNIYKSLENFVGIFNDYIVFIINVFYPNFKKDKQDNFTKKEDVYLFDKVHKIFSFNYTSTYVSLYNFSNHKEKIETLSDSSISNNKVNIIDFIHGTYVENWSENLDNLKIVLGVDDIHNSLKKHKLFQFTKYFQKLNKQTDYLFLKDFEVNLKTKHNKKYIFYFWGHSLDYSDRQYIREVFDIVPKTDGMIKVFYHSISSKGDQLKNLLSIIDKEIIEYFMKNNILQFIESNPENLFNEL